MRADSNLRPAGAVSPSWPDLTIKVLSFFIFLLGLSVALGWSLRSHFLVQLGASMAPMQYNTALGFIISGAGLYMLQRGYIKGSAFSGVIVFLLSSLTLVQYPLDVNLGLDELFMTHYITVETSNPGRMAPNTALAFMMTGISLYVAGSKAKAFSRSFTLSIFGSLILAVGSVALIGYLGGLDTAHGWGNLTHMAAHTSAGFILVGVCLIRTAWLAGISDEGHPPLWLPAPLAIGALTALIMAEQALLATPYWQANAHIISGLLMAVMIGFAIRLAQIYREESQQAYVLNERLQEQVAAAALTEKSLRESEARFRTLVETADDAIILMDLDFNRLYENEASWSNLGYTYEDWKALGPWWERIHPDDLDSVKREAGALLQAGAAVSKYRIRRKDGSWAVRQSKSKIIHSEGKPLAVISILRDLTEMEKSEEALRKSERKYRQLTEQASDGIFVVDAGGRYLDVNPAGLAMVGYTLDEIRKLRITDLIPKEEAVSRPSRFNEILDGKTVVNERTLIRKDGSRFIAEITAKIMSDGTVLATKRDITSRKRAEEALLAAKQNAEQANRSKSIFLSSVSHEIRTPLTAILGFSQFLASDTKNPLNDYQRGLLDKVIDSGDQLLGLINSVLDLAKIESGQIELSIQALNVSEQAKMAVITASPYAEKLRVKLRIFETAEDTFVKADRAHLSQILTNLISNAVKYNRPGGLTTVSWRPVDGGKVRISVSDEGMGISPELMTDLFKPFERLGKEGHNIHGFGIGLTIVKRLTEFMGGQVIAESQPGRGSIFHIDLPAGAPPEPEVSGKGGDSYEAMPKTMSGRILYIEDDENCAEIVRLILLKWAGLTLTICRDAEEGISHARAFHPDLILLDIELPGLSGYDALALLKNSADTGNIPVVAISANAFHQNVEAGEKAGFDAYITKPFTAAQLVKTIGQFLA